MIIGICVRCKKEFRKRERKYKFCSLICASKNNQNGLKKIKLPQHSNLLAEFIGICLGDGYISKYQTSITLNTVADKEYIPYVVNLSTKLFPEVTISLVKKKHDHAVDVRLNSKVVADFLRNMGIVPRHKKIPDWIFTSFEYKKFCVRGLFDTEGSFAIKIYESKTKGTRLYYQLNFRNYDKKLMKFVRDTLLEQGINPTMTLTKSLYLSNPQSINLYQKCIGYRNPKFFKIKL